MATTNDEKVQEAARRALKDNGMSERHAETLADLFKATHTRSKGRKS